MDSPKTRTLPPPSRMSPEALDTALLHWDELDETSLVALAAHPTAGPRLTGLRAAERWLRQGAPTASHLDAQGLATSVAPRSTPADCPTPEELFDLGRGPGYAPLPAEREAALQAHLASCEDCALLVVTLASPPPLPIDESSPADGIKPRREQPRFEPARRLPRSRTWVPFLVAASLAAVAILPQLLGPNVLGIGDLPPAPLLRGELTSELLFPRDRVLALPGSVETPSARPNFELSPVPGAEGYRVELFLHDGGALEAGTLKQLLRSPGPDLGSADPLPPGHYTWRAWVDVDGLERPLGALDFEVIEDAELAAVLQLGLSDPAPSVASLVGLITQLHQAGLRTDARTLARRLPESLERDRYLLPPGR